MLILNLLLSIFLIYFYTAELHKQKLKEYKQQLAKEKEKRIISEDERQLLNKYNLNNIDKKPKNSKTCKRRYFFKVYII